MRNRTAVRRFDPKAPAIENYAKALNKPCVVCKKPAVATIRVYACVSDLATNPELAHFVLEQHGRKVPTIDTPQGQQVRVSQTNFCVACLPAGERAAAKGPSYLYVHIETVPKQEAKVFAVGA